MDRGGGRRIKAIFSERGYLTADGILHAPRPRELTSGVDLEPGTFVTATTELVPNCTIVRKMPNITYATPICFSSGAPGLAD
jgi:hypothetical protein